MAAVVKVSDRVEYIGSQDWDREIFDSLIPLPDGTSYNSFIVHGSEKTALIDTVDMKFVNEFMPKIERLERLDFIVINHVEQDHSGCLNKVLDRFPGSVVLCTEKAKDLIVTHLHTDPSRIVTVKDGEEASLGDRTLRFVHAPFVHWPETMLTFLVEDSILFSCDMFGSHMASSEVFTCGELCTYEEPCKRYYAEIMMPFSAQIKKNLDKVEHLSPKMICPSHGPCWTEPGFVIGLYRKWTQGEPSNKALILHVSMHGSTAAMVDRLTDRLSEAGIKVSRIDITKPDLGKIGISLVDAHTLVVATPTVLGGPHPAAASMAILANALRPRLKLIGIIGSFGWGGKAPEVLASLVPNLSGAELLEPLMIKGMPDEGGMQRIDEFAQKIAEKHAAAFPGEF
ncbi:MAG TPA: FprA family A-type flavoprotein [Bacillota bacterium]|nr:FprA family A-type flavoprotein [Bacillota bacterium]HOA14948.1 FprA family A-type flavoprotein [Bacillota bacterium]HOG53168.1 FprA family A-type flavoprotein [Bacillota bacterium]